MENLVISSTSTCKHPQLEKLHITVERMVDVFDAIPLEFQMDGLDIIQGVVSRILQKMTHGRLASVKFVPVEKSDSPERIITVKEEPVEDTRPPSPLCSTLQTSTQMTPMKDVAVPVTPRQLFARKSVTTTKQGRKLTPKQANKAQQMAAKRVGPISELNLKESNALKMQNVKRRKISDEHDESETNNFESNQYSNEIVAAKHGTDADEGSGYDDGHEPIEYTSSTLTESTDEKGDVNGVALKDHLSPEDVRAIFRAGGKKRKKPLNYRHWKDVPDPSKEKLSCNQCPYFTDNQQSLEIHQMAHTGDITCPQCAKKFTSPASLRRHMLLHGGEKEFACPVCNKAFYTRQSLKDHAVSHTGSRAHKCPLCEKSYTLRCNLSRHMRVHTGEKPYKCSICPDTAFRDLSSLNFHRLKHTGERPFSCDQCDKKFRTSSDLIRHQRSLHSSERAYTCHQCGMSFKVRGTLHAHMMVHTDFYMYKCELCRKSFRSKNSLEHHMRWHSGVKPYTCDTCNKSFSTKTYLAAHQVLHGFGEKFECKTCGKVFSHRSNRNRHIRIHSAERRYKCKYCPKAFKYTNALSYHEGIHTGVKETCEKCGVAFRTKKSLRMHNCERNQARAEKQKHFTPTLKQITPGTSSSLKYASSLSGLKLKVKLAPKFKKSTARKGEKSSLGVNSTSKKNSLQESADTDTSSVAEELPTGSMTALRRNRVQSSQSWGEIMEPSVRLKKLDPRIVEEEGFKVTTIDLNTENNDVQVKDHQKTAPNVWNVEASIEDGVVVKEDLNINENEVEQQGIDCQKTTPNVWNVVADGVVIKEEPIDDEEADLEAPQENNALSIVSGGIELSTKDPSEEMEQEEMEELDLDGNDEEGLVEGKDFVVSLNEDFDEEVVERKDHEEEEKDEETEEDVEKLMGEDDKATNEVELEEEKEKEIEDEEEVENTRY